MSSLVYRSPLGGKIRFADWLNDLRNQSGAYVIRSSQTKETIYVGESHTGRLAATIKRHFHEWKDSVERRHYTYSPHRVEVAVRTCPPSAAVGAQDNLIARLSPRDNSNCGGCVEPF